MFLTVSNLRGDSTDKNHVNDADVLAFAWSASQNVSMHSGTGASAGKPSLQDLTITKYLDSMSVGLQAALFKGANLLSVVLRTYKAGQSQLNYLTYELTDVLVTSYGINGTGGEDGFTETLTFNFSKIKITTYKTVGGANTGTSVTYDVARNTTS